MDTLLSRWFLSILLVTLQNKSSASEGPPASPSQPECFRTCDDHHCSVDVRCVWDPRADPETPANYSLHWQSADSDDGEEKSSVGELIFREHSPRHEELRVWVKAWNQHGSAKSEELVFNADDIIKPPPPKFSSSHREPLEVSWNTSCDLLQLSVGTCELRYRTEEDPAWMTHSGLHSTDTFTDPTPGAVHELQVRCSCHTGLMSDWSAVLQIQSAELAPVGEVDVWWDCGLLPSSSDCYLTWKSLPAPQARGLVLGYEVEVSFSNGTTAHISLSTAAPSSHVVYAEDKWCLRSSLKGVASVSVSAHNALGSTPPSLLAPPLTAKEEGDQAMYLEMEEERLAVSWDRPAGPPDHLKEYLVQYKEVGGAAGRGFDWVKVNNQTVGFTGQFKKYTPYQVSLFLISHSREVHLLKSLIGFSQEKAPSTSPPSFKVLSIEETEVTLLWEPVPLTKQNGLVLYYQIGGNIPEVWNVSASPQQGNQTWTLRRLTPGRDYVLWLRAVNAAGPGPNTTTRFQTKQQLHYGIERNIILLFSGMFVTSALLCFCSVVTKKLRLHPKFFIERIPDPSNSHIFRQMKHQMNEPFACTCIPIKEADPDISQVEVLEDKSRALDPDWLTGPEVGDDSSQVQNDEADLSDPEDLRRYGRKAYSKMVDLDEERNDCSDSSEEEEFASGYEKHFMPTATDVLEV